MSAPDHRLDRRSAPDGTLLGLLLCLFLSGGSGLVYEVAWVRSLELVFGATSFAVATVLAAFMGGLALGSWGMGRLSRPLRRFQPLKIYAALELLVGGSSLLVPVLLARLVPLYQEIWRLFHASFIAFGLFRFLLCSVVLLLPAALMGATLPIASRMIPPGERHADAARRVGLLYAVNTLGAVCGCAAAGLVLLPDLGLRRAQWSALALNVLAALGALLLSRGAASRREGSESSGPGPDPPAPDGTAAALSRGRARALVGMYAVSGGIAMIYEVAWSRLLVLVLGSSTYAYTLMLTTFLLGLSAGAWLGGRLLKERPDPLLAAALCQVEVALTTYAGLYLMRELPYLYVRAWDRLHPGPGGLLAVQFLLSSLLFFLPTLGLGGMFPITLAGLRPAGGAAPRIVGVAYACNTLGAIGGSILAGFLLVPRLGSRDTLLCGVVTGALLGLCGLAAGRMGIRPALATSSLVAIGLFIVAAVLSPPVLSADILSSGVFRYADRYRGLDRDAFHDSVRANHGEILMFDEGLTSTVTVFRTTAARTLLVNGKPDASVPPGLPDLVGARRSARPGDLPTQILVAHVPLLLAGRADRVLVVGLGSGVTLGSVLRHPVRRVDAVELEEAVVRASRLFDDESGAPLDDPRVRLLVNDARNHFLMTGERYDVIISEPSNPWVAGAASLFTEEFFRLASDRLAAGGWFCQWLQLYEMEGRDLQAILRSFTDVFPDTHVFRVDGDAILAGRVAAGPLTLQSILSRAGRPALADLERIGVRTPGDLLAHYWIGGRELLASLDEGPRNTDDNMLIEFAAPLRVLARAEPSPDGPRRPSPDIFGGRTTGLLRQLILPPGTAGVASDSWAALGSSTLAAGYPDLALAYAGRSLALRRGPLAARVTGEALASSGREPEGRRVLQDARREFPQDAGLLRELLTLERQAQDWTGARRDAETLLRLRPEDRVAAFILGESLARLGDREAALARLARLAPDATESAASGSALLAGTAAASIPPAADPEFPDLDLLLGTLLVETGRPARAVPYLRRHLLRHPGDRRARSLQVEALRRSDRPAEAAAEARRLDPDGVPRAALAVRRAEEEWESSPGDRLRSLLEEARLDDPDNDAAAFLLARALARGGDRERAVAVAEEFLEGHPDRPWAIGYLSQLDTETGDAARAGLLAQRYRALTGRDWTAIPGG